MSELNTALINRFYQAFQRLDGPAMAACYAPDVVFSDPGFGTLRGRDAGDMWCMLTARAKALSVRVDSVRADAHSGAAHWVATYAFGPSERTVVNRVQARFVFRDGLIREHHDHFDAWAWSRQALGPAGVLFGWSPWLRNKIRRQALLGLKKYQDGSGTA
ncbi:nuclear transport factor 2 family protein [Pseudomonas sp. nanlin1]|uniref:nuclear transport factor 2 family protein n=1 Tax=Pseudomonas sp. nanlin1 TaxID=3040605 RepID=UPI00388F5A9D